MELSQYLPQFKVKKLLKSVFIRNVAMVAGGTVIAQIATVAFSPIITRLYGPEAFGVLGVFLSVTTILSTVSSLCYVHAVVLPKDDADGLRILHLSLKIAAIISVITAGVIIPFRESIAALLDMEAVAPYLLLVPLSVYLAALAQGYDQWLVRTKHFKASSAITVIQSLSLNGLKTGVGFIAPFAVVLIGLSTFGHALHVFLSAVFSRESRHKVKEMMFQQGHGRTRELANEYQDFPYYRAPKVFINAISHNLPVLLLATFYGPSAAGFYVVGVRILKLPSTFLSQSLGKVFLPRLTEAAHRGENVQGLIKKATLGLAGIGIIPFGLIVVLGPWLFGFIFGAEWVRAGEYARWMALWLYFDFMNVPSVQTVIVLGMQRWQLIFQSIVVVLRICSLLVVFILFKNDLTAVILFSMVGVAINIILIYLVYIKSRHSSRWVLSRGEGK